MLQPKLINVKPIRELKLQLTYENGEIKLFNVAPYVSGNWYSELSDFSYFSTVKLLPNGVGIEWLNGQDIAPHELYENSVAVS